MSAASTGRTHGCNPTAPYRFSLAPGGRPHMALLVHGQHYRVARRVHGEADDVLHLLGEGRISGTLEGAHAVRLKAVLVPDGLDQPQRDAGRGSNRATGPVGDIAGRLGAGQRQHLGDGAGGVGRLAGRVLSRRRPSTPTSAKRCYQRQAAVRLTPAWWATSSTGRRSADCRTMQARWTCLRGRARSWLIARSRTFSSSVRIMQAV